MPIKLIFNGFYRSGSTIMWWIIKKSNPQMLHLYEPLHPDLFNLLKEYYPGKINPMHNLPIFDDYFKLPKNILKHMESAHKDFTILFTASDVFTYLDIIHKIDIPIVLQPNRMHFILNEITVRYDCKWIHIIRNPVDTYISILTLFKKYSNFWDKIKAFLLGKSNIGSYFYIDAMYNAFSKKFSVFVKPNDYIGKFLIVWTFSNYSAYMQFKNYDKGLIVYYEDIVESPQKEFKKIEEFAEIHMKKEFSQFFQKKYLWNFDKRLKNKFISKSKEIGLFEIVEKVFPFNRLP